MALLSTVVWQCRPDAVDTNGGGYDSTISGATTDLSQTDAAAWTATDLAGSTVAATDLFVTTATAGPNDGTWRGNLLHINSGTGFTAGFYAIQSVAGSGPWTLTLDRAPCTAINSTGGAGAVGGAVQNLFVLLSVASGVSAGHVVNIRSRTGLNQKVKTWLSTGVSSVGTPGTLVVGSTTGMPATGNFYVLVDTELFYVNVLSSTQLNVVSRAQATPMGSNPPAASAHTGGANATSGAPVLYLDYVTSRTGTSTAGAVGSVAVGRIIVQGVNGRPYIANVHTTAGSGLHTSTLTYYTLDNIGIVLPKNGYSGTACLTSGATSIFLRGELWWADPAYPSGSSTIMVNAFATVRETACGGETFGRGSTPNLNNGCCFVGNTTLVENCTFANGPFAGVSQAAGSTVRGCTFTGNLGAGVAANSQCIVENNTFDGGLSHGVTLPSTIAVGTTFIKNNIFSNNINGTSLPAISVNSGIGSLTVNDKLCAGLIFNNVFYNNSLNYGGGGGVALISGPKPGDITGIDPGITSAKKAAGDWSIPGALAAAGYPSASQLPTGFVSRPYIDPGAIQRQEPAFSASEVRYVG